MTLLARPKRKKPLKINGFFNFGGVDGTLTANNLSQ